MRIRMSAESTTTGVVGAFNAHYINFLEPDYAFSGLWVTLPIVAAIFGGYRTIVGPLAGAVTLYLIDQFHVPVPTAQLYLFAFLVGIVIGTIAGGALADRVGRIPVMWFSILGALPFALILPYANLFWTGVLAVVIAIIIASASSAILVYAQELMPGRVGLTAGVFYGLAFGLGGVGAAVPSATSPTGSGAGRRRQRRGKESVNFTRWSARLR